MLTLIKLIAKSTNPPKKIKTNPIHIIIMNMKEAGLTVRYDKYSGYHRIKDDRMENSILGS